MKIESELTQDEMWGVYSLPLARYLISNGYKCYKAVPDLMRPNFYNWLFKNTDELHKSIENYDLEKHGNEMNREDNYVCK